jgi:SagB-type dehydrogenase family enzyme
VNETLALRSDAKVEMSAEGVSSLVEGHIRAPLGRLGPALARALDALLAGAEEDVLVASAIEAEGEQAVMKLQLLLRRLEQGGWLTRSVHVGGKPLVTMHPIGHVTPGQPPFADLSKPVRLSRFAALRADGGRLRVESPLHSVFVELHEPMLAGMLATLAVPATVDVVAEAHPWLPSLAVRPVLRLLRDAAVVGSGDAAEHQAREGQWSFVDLHFHARSRAGRNLGGFGGTYHRREAAAPLPAIRAPWPEAVALPKPDLVSVTAADPPFGEVLERRHSTRLHDDSNPITVGELGELLYRVARVRGVMNDGMQELSSRPYPGGGACYELELYLLVNNCTGVEPGLYHYDPSGHALGLVAEPGPPTILLSEYARITAVMDSPPQVAVMIAARFGRVMWKYESMAYALILKHVGVTLQTLYLTATAMGLGACALGGGNSDAFCAASGLDFCEETTVGEFILGRPAVDAGAYAQP